MVSNPFKRKSEWDKLEEKWATPKDIKKFALRENKDQAFRRQLENLAEDLVVRGKRESELEEKENKEMQKTLERLRVEKRAAEIREATLEPRKISEKGMTGDISDEALRRAREFQEHIEEEAKKEAEWIEYQKKTRELGEGIQFKPTEKMISEGANWPDLERRKLELELEKLELEKQVAQRQLEAGGGGRGGAGGGGTGGPSGGGGAGGQGGTDGGTPLGSGTPTPYQPQQEELARLRAKQQREEREIFAGMKRESKHLGVSLGVAAIPALAITVVAYFVLNNWIALGVNLLPAPIGPLLNNLWWVVYLAIGLLSWAILSQGKSPATTLISGFLIAGLIWLVFGVLLGIFTSFLGPLVGPGLYCSLAQVKAQQGGVIPTECITSQTQQANAQKTGSVNLLSVSFGQSGVPFPEPRQGQQYQFPITLYNPSEFDIGPIVIESGYMCGKVGGFPTCGGFDNNNKFVPNFIMSSTNCESYDNKCIIGSGGPPLVVSLTGACSTNPDHCIDSNGKTKTDDTVPFPSSYVNLYVDVRYPFTTAGTNDFFIAQTTKDVPKSAPSCQGSGTRELGTACTGAGPLNVIPSFSESSFSLDGFGRNDNHRIYLVIYLSNVGDGTARIDTINVTRFTSDGLTATDVNSKDNKINCYSPILGKSITKPNNPNNLLGQQDKYYFADGNPTDSAQTYGYYQENLNAIGDNSQNLDFLIGSHESAQVLCYYTVKNTAKLPGPSMDVKVESQVSYDYYKTPQKTDILVKPAFQQSTTTTTTGSK